LKALVIVGHGSHLNGDSSLPVYEHAARIREDIGGFDEVVECFWKEEPSMRHVLDTVESDEVFVVPAFISQGYFTEQVIPRELGLEGPLTKKDGKTIHYAGPLGTFEGMPDVILERTADLMRGKEAGGTTALVLLGHGTDLNKNSSGVIYLNADRIRDRNIYDIVAVGFLDQEPEIGSVVESVEAENVIVIPVFIAEGWHTRETIPEDLDLDGEVTVREGRTIFYGAPVGTHPSMARLIADRAREAEAASLA
jgi:sirohydrochlorin cobaltochelatase